MGRDVVFFENIYPYAIQRAEDKNEKINSDHAAIEENLRDTYAPAQPKEGTQYSESNESASNGPGNGPLSGAIPPMAQIEPTVDVDGATGTSGETGPPNDGPGSEGSLADRGSLRQGE